MTVEESIAKALEVKLKNRYYAEKGQVSLDFIEASVHQAIEELRNEEVPDALVEQAASKEVKKSTLLDPLTSSVLQDVKQYIYNKLSEVIMNPEFDPDGFLSALAYWYEFQQLARAYGKKLLYVTPKKKESK